MNAPAPPPAGVPVQSADGVAVNDLPPTAAELAMRAIKIGRVSFNEIWMLANRECGRAETTGQLHEREGRAATPGSVKARQHAEIAAAAFSERDCFYAICRLVERMKSDRTIVERLRDMADRENAAAQSDTEKANEADAAAAADRRLNGEESD